MDTKINKCPRYFGEDEFKAYPLFKNQPKIFKVKGTFFQEIIEFAWKRLSLKGYFARLVWKRRLKDKNGGKLYFRY